MLMYEGIRCTEELYVSQNICNKRLSYFKKNLQSFSFYENEAIPTKGPASDG